VHVNRTRKIAVVAVAALTLAGCNWGGGAKADAPDVDCNAKPSPCVNLTHATILREPEGFRNISFGCMPGTTTGVYVTSRGIYEVGAQNAVPLPSTVTVLANDPACK
jgi:hypothetical protein